MEINGSYFHVRGGAGEEVGFSNYILLFAFK